jgi:O-methyltransferase
VVQFNEISGYYAEFGCDGGTSVLLAWREISANPVPRHIWAFDSFAGLPKTEDPRDDHSAWVPITMAMGVEGFHSVLTTRGVPRDTCTTVDGYFAESLPRLGSDGPLRDIALAYIDCDVYSSTVSVLELLRPRLEHGMILAFDDYYCWTESQVSGERAAVDEFAADHPEWNIHRYMSIDWDGVAFVVEDASWRRATKPMSLFRGGRRRPRRT